MDVQPNVIVGGLLDLFVYAVVIRLHESDTGTRYFVSERVHEPEAYILCLLLNLFGLPMEDIVDLLLNSRSASEGNVPFFQAAEYDEENTDDGTNLHSVFSGLKMDDSLSPTVDEELPGVVSVPMPPAVKGPAKLIATKKKMAKVITIYREKVRELLQWDTRRLGFAPLTESELNKRNMAPGGSSSSSSLKWVA